MTNDSGSRGKNTIHGVGSADCVGSETEGHSNEIEPPTNSMTNNSLVALNAGQDTSMVNDDVEERLSNQHEHVGDEIRRPSSLGKRSKENDRGKGHKKAPRSALKRQTNNDGGRKKKAVRFSDSQSSRKGFPENDEEIDGRHQKTKKIIRLQNQGQQVETKIIRHFRGHLQGFNVTCHRLGRSFHQMTNWVLIMFVSHVRQSQIEVRFVNRHKDRYQMLALIHLRPRRHQCLLYTQ